MIESTELQSNEDQLEEMIFCINESFILPIPPGELAILIGMPLLVPVRVVTASSFGVSRGVVEIASVYRSHESLEMSHTMFIVTS